MSAPRQPKRETRRQPQREPRRQPKRTQSKLKRQPQIRRVNRTSRYQPAVELPNTVQQRRRHRRRQNYARPLAVGRAIFTSSRWISGGILALTIYAIFFMTTNLNFYINVIPVEGLFSVTPGEVVATSGLAGRHIFAADPIGAAEEISDLPGIISAEVNLAWPNQVKVTVEEETPIAVWKDDDAIYWVNADGAIFPARREIPGLVAIHSTNQVGILGQTFVESPGVTAEPVAEIEAEAENGPPAPEIDQYGFIPEEILQGALQIDRMRGAEMAEKSIRYLSEQGLSFRDARGWDVYLGTGIDMEQKLVVYDAIITTILANGETPEYVSVSNQHRPFYKPIAP